MPRRNTRRPRRRIGLYHVYNRTKDGSRMFRDEADKRRFVEIFSRYLEEGRSSDEGARRFASLFFGVRVLTFALMPNHFHLIVFQLTPGTMEDLMQRSLTAYVRYYNDRYGLSGPLFAGEYRADIKVDRRSQLNAIAYVNDNHPAKCECDFCGGRYYREANLSWPRWLDIERGLGIFGGVEAYREFCAARQTLRQMAAGE